MSKQYGDQVVSMDRRSACQSVRVVRVSRSASGAHGVTRPASLTFSCSPSLALPTIVAELICHGPSLTISINLGLPCACKRTLSWSFF